MSKYDSTGKPISIGDKVRFRGQFYTIKSFGNLLPHDAHAIYFNEEQHIPELADEFSVDLVEGS